MFAQQIITDATQQFANLIKNNPLADIENNFKTILQATFDKLDLVSRHEFDIQQKVLADTRAKLAELEEIIKKLESR